LGTLTGQALSMADFVRALSDQLGRPVLDKTGLTGKYDLTLQWTPDDSQLPGLKAGRASTATFWIVDLHSNPSAAWSGTGIARQPRGDSRHRSCREAFGELTAVGVCDAMAANL